MESRSDKIYDYLATLMNRRRISLPNVNPASPKTLFAINPLLAFSPTHHLEGGNQGQSWTYDFNMHDFR